MNPDLKKLKTKSSFLSGNMVELLNYRIQQEELSSRIYLAMSVSLDDMGYKTASKLWKKFSDEELSHANKAREFLLSFDILPETRPLESVKQDYKGLPEIIRDTLKHEELITTQCQELSKKSLQENNMLVFSLGQFYCAEQVEEMSKSFDLVNLLDLYGEDKLALKMLEHELESWL